MSTLAISMAMCVSGRWPATIAASAWGIDNFVPMSGIWAIRPREGERVPPPLSQVLFEREGLEGDDVRCVLRLVGGKSKDAWTGMIRGARTVIVHDFDETDYRIKVARIEHGMAPDWRRPAIRIVDTLDIARSLLGTEARVSLSEAAKAITGRELAGIDALVGIFNTPEAAKVIRAA